MNDPESRLNQKAQRSISHYMILVYATHKEMSENLQKHQI